MINISLKYSHKYGTRMSTDSKNWTQIKHNKKNQQKPTFFSEHMDTEDSIENILRWFYIPFFIEIFDRKCLFYRDIPVRN